MRKIQRFLALAGAAAVALSPLLFSACSEGEQKQVLRIYNWEDYICNEDDEEAGYIDLIAAFEEAYGCTVEYSTFGTNENMYNELKINEGSYDLVCPSDYMIMKMINENMCEPFSEDFKTNSSYAENVSPYIKNIFEENGWDDYAAGYMWGTMGFLYNPAASSTIAEDVQSWLVLENEAYENKATLKDSVRDTYFYALACVYNDELAALAEVYESGGIDAETYNDGLNEIMNRTDEETVEKARVYLREIKKNIYGFEVDSGKNDMVTGKIDINFCWSGDAAYGIYEAGEEDGSSLAYSVPDYVSNIWFDGWVIPKGGNVELAEAFLDFISRPEYAMMNMDYIGYTSVIAGDEIYENWVLDGYEVEETGAALEEMIENGEAVAYDLGYFFSDDPDTDAYTFYAYAGEENGMLGAQYPTYEVVLRCAVMQYFEEDANNRINMMWEDVKGAEIPIPAVIFIAVIIAVGAGVYLFTKYGYDWFRGKPKKGYTKVNGEEK